MIKLYKKNYLERIIQQINNKLNLIHQVIYIRI
jgi:hypothetical protein